MTTPAVTLTVEKKEAEPKPAAPAKKPVAPKEIAKKSVAKKAPTKRNKSTLAAKSRATKKATRREAFPYEKVARMWHQGKTITEISKATGYFNAKSDDPNHRLRVALTAMHKGWRDAKGKLHKLPHRVKKSSLAASRRAGKKAAA